MWSVVGIIGLLVLAVVLLYLPPVQNLVVKKALESVNKSGDMHISVKKLRLGFPLDLTIDSLSMQAPGMDIAAGKAAADIAFMPLLGGNAVVRDLSVNDAIINLGTPDSALYMRSSVKLARLEDTKCRIVFQPYRHRAAYRVGRRHIHDYDPRHRACP